MTPGHNAAAGTRTPPLVKSRPVTVLGTILLRDRRPWGKDLRHRVDRFSVVDEPEVEMRPGGEARPADPTNHLLLLYPRAHLEPLGVSGEMAVVGDVAVVVANLQQTTEASLPALEDHLAVHLSAYANGLNVGSRVQQKQVIGRVGRTGLATGPHLDYRLKLGGRFVDPLKVKFPAGRPVTVIAQPRFAQMRDLRLAELLEVSPALVLEAAM